MQYASTPSDNSNSNPATTTTDTSEAATSGSNGTRVIAASFSRYHNVRDTDAPQHSRLDNIKDVMDLNNDTCFQCFRDDQRYIQTTFAVQGASSHVGVYVLGYHIICSEPNMLVYNKLPPNHTRTVKITQAQCNLKESFLNPNTKKSMCGFRCSNSHLLNPLQVSVVLRAPRWKFNDQIKATWCETLFRVQ